MNRSVPSGEPSVSTRGDTDISDGDTVSQVSRLGSTTRKAKASSNYADDDSVVRTINPGFNKVGKGGTEVDVVTNYYYMNEAPQFKLYQYRVDFTPVEDNTTLKKALLRQNEGTIGRYVFDGSIMYLTRLLPAEQQSLNASSSGCEYKITIRLVGQVNPEDSMFLQFYNIVMRKCMNILGFEELGRNMYDRSAAIKLPEEKIHLWPGFSTAIRNHEIGTLLCVEVTHKVLRMSSVLEQIMSLKRPGMSSQDFVSSS